MEHSPEPWEQQGVFIVVNGISIHEARQRKQYEGSPRYPELLQQDEANARRIVACVNACAGIPTEVLEDVTGLYKISVTGGLYE